MQPQRKKLLIGLDGIPHTALHELKLPTIDTLTPRRYALVSRFPSATNWALAAPLGFTPPSYEFETYLDYDTVKSKTLPILIRELLFDDKKEKDPDIFSSHFDYCETFLRYLLSFITPLKRAALHKSLDELDQYFIRNKHKDTITAFLSTADCIVHTEGNLGAHTVLHAIDHLLARHPDLTHERDVTLFSDHGMAPSTHRQQLAYFDYTTLLHVHGYHPAQWRGSKKIRKSHEYLAPYLAQVSYLGITCTDDHTNRISEILLSHDAVDHVLTRTNGTIHIHGKNGGRARLTTLTTLHGTRLYDYAPTHDGDPLQLNINGLLTHHEAFAETCHHHYPNPLERITEAFHDVKTPSTLLVNLNPDYYAGSKRLNTLLTRLRIIEKLHATHGSLTADHTNGILLTNTSDYEDKAHHANGTAYLRINDLTLKPPHQKKSA